MKLIILSTDPTILKWKTLAKKLTFIDRALASGKNADFAPTVVKYIKVKPKVVNARIDHDWLEELKAPYFRQGFDIIGFHTSEKQWKSWGIQANLRGANPNRSIELEDFYFNADENSRRLNFNRFEQVALHEIAHGYYDHSDEADITHQYHDAHRDISGLFRQFDWGKYQPERIALRRRLQALQRSFISMLNGVVKSLTPSPTYRLPFRQWSTPSQPYGVSNPNWYPLTGHHIGTDFPTPVGTPIFAPADCEVTRVGNKPTSLGYWCEVKLDGKYIVFAHLQAKPSVGIIKRGWVIAFTGNTGFTQGVHCHVEGWHEPMNRQKLGPNTWRDLTFDVTTII